jgi:membrane fusion protein (multidrug efflux system)
MNSKSYTIKLTTMNKIIPILSLAIFLFSCSEQKLTLSDKKDSLKVLKEQLSETKTQISILEKEIATLDTTMINGAIVKTTAITASTFKHYIEQLGTVSSKQNVTVSPTLGGVVQKIIVDEGEWVNKGEDIIELDAEIILKQVEEMEASFKLAETTYKRQKKLWEQKIGSEMQFLQIKNQYESLQKKLESAKAQLGNMKISAPISGNVDVINLNVGEFAAPGIPILQIVNAKEVQIQADVPEKYANILHKGGYVSINFSAIGIEKEAKITFVSQIINPQNRTFKIKIDLDNKNGEIKPNAIASLQIQDKYIKDAIVIPTEVIKKDMRGDFIFIAEKNHAKKVYITLGKSYKYKTHITSGLNINDLLITTGYTKIGNESPIKIIQ